MTTSNTNIFEMSGFSPNSRVSGPTNHWWDNRVFGPTNHWWDNHFQIPGRYELAPPFIAVGLDEPHYTRGEFLDQCNCLNFRIHGEARLGVTYEHIINGGTSGIITMFTKEVVAGP